MEFLELPMFENPFLEWGKRAIYVWAREATQGCTGNKFSRRFEDAK